MFSKTRLYVLLVVVGLSTVAAQANAPFTSLRPVAREDVFPVALPSFAPIRSLRPMLRPKNWAPTVVSTKPRPVSVATGMTGKISRVCGDRHIRGIEIGTVPGRLPGCGIKNAVKVYEVAGVTLSTPATINCDTAKAIKDWFSGGMSKAARPMRSKITKVRVAASYSCRTRNHKPGAKLSEHAFGNAIDFSEFHFANGQKITLIDDWGRGREGRVLRDMWRSACGPFGTVLGPESDRYHKDHFHFDVARYRSGPYCR